MRRALLVWLLASSPVQGSDIGLADSFPGLDWETGGPANVLPLGQPQDPSKSYIHCSGTASENRTCRLYNVCFDPTQRESDNAPLLIVYTGGKDTMMTMQLLGEDGVTRTVPVPTDKWREYSM